jgi:hypothetical protein
MKRVFLIVVFSALTILVCAGLLAAQTPSVITQVTSGTSTTASQAGICPCYLGMTFTTPGGGPWNNITFNLYQTPAAGTNPASLPEAVGTAFILTQPYFGTPANLSTSTTGYVTSTNVIASGVYIFPPNIVLDPNTQYFFYANAQFPNATYINNSLPISFIVSPAIGLPNFAQITGSPNFSLSGTTVAAGACTYVLNGGGQTFPAAGGGGTISVTAPSGCAWTASSSASWVTISGAGNGTGNGTVTYQLAPNNSTAQTAAINITSTTGNITFYVMQGAASVSGYTGGGTIAQLASAGNWTTTFTFVNTGTAAAQMRLNFFNGAGAALGLPLTFPQSPIAAGTIFATGTIDETINPGTVLVIQTTGPASQVTKTGWAQLLTNGSITGFATYSEVLGSTTQEALVPLQGSTAPAYLIAYDNTNGNGTAIALVNTTNQPITVTMTVVIGGAVGSTTDGLGDGSVPLTLQPRSYTAFFTASQFTDTANTRGTLKFSTGTAGQISVLGLRFNPTGAYSSIPAIATTP